jgi:hypothetical protein
MMVSRAPARRTECAVQKDKLPSALGEALLDAVVARRPPKDYRPRRPDQPANTFANRSGEIASAPDAPAPMRDKGRGDPLIHEVQLGRGGKGEPIRENE